MSKMQDLEIDLEDKADRRGPVCETDGMAQATQGESSDGGTGMLGRIQEALARGEQPQALEPNVDGSTPCTPSHSRCWTMKPKTCAPQTTTSASGREGGGGLVDPHDFGWLWVRNGVGEARRHAG